MSEKPAKAYVERDFMSDGVKIATKLNDTHYLWWERPLARPIEEASGPATSEGLLCMPEDVALAVYEALADHFGHAGHDIRALRKDYDAERNRVDLFIAALTKDAQR